MAKKLNSAENVIYKFIIIRLIDKWKMRFKD